MPQISLTEALRYFFAPFVLFLYLVVYDSSLAARLQTKFGAVGVIAFLVAGSVLYFLYRLLIYDVLILWLYDVFRNETYRRYLGKRYGICSGKYWLPMCTVRARKLFIQIDIPKDRFNGESLRIAAAGIHLLYQSGLIAIPFIILASQEDALSFLFFGTLGLVLCVTGAFADMDYEDQELILLKSLPGAADKAAKLLGYPTDACTGGSNNV